MQGPLTATLLADRLAARTSARLAAFTFRGQQPLFSGERLHLCGQSGDAGHHELWAETPVGTKAMVATAQAEDLDNDQFHANMLAPILNHRNPESGT